MQESISDHSCRTNSPWNRGKLIGPKPPLKAKEIWSIRVRLQVANRIRDLALFNLALDSKLRACDVVALRVDDVALNGRVRSRATVIQQKTGRPVQFEITEQTREAVGRWLEKKDLHKGETLFPSRINRRRPMTTRQYARLLASWLRAIGLDPSAYGTYSLQRTKASMIYRRTGNLRAVQLLLGHTKIESTVQYLGIDDALLIAEQVEI
jgi:integrase